MAIFRVSFTTRCRQCALMIWRSTLDAHGFRMTASAVLEHEDSECGARWVTVAATGAVVSVPENVNKPCMIHRAVLDQAHAAVWKGEGR
jgi:hypothetical protein